MATKDHCLLNIVNGEFDQYSNINLKQNYQSLHADDVQLKTAINNSRKNENYDFTDSHDLYTTKNSHSWNKSNKLSSLSFLNFNEESEEKHQIKKSKSTNNNSTLSLHIAAYENSVEDPGDSNGGKTEDSKNEKSILIKKLEASKQGFCRSLSFIQNPFEFTRQQEDRRNHPEVMQFKASQQLLNPNEENLLKYGSSMDLSEYIKKSRVDNVLLKHGPRPKSYGTIALTSHHFIFQPAPSQNSNSGRNDELWLLLRAVDIAVSEATMMNKGILTLKCKNFMICSFEMEKPHDASLLVQSINALSNLKSPGHEFPYFYRSPFTVLDDGWNIYDVSQQFCELSTMFPDIFRLTSVNKDYHVCSSYPDKSIVVKGVGDDYLRLCATFRRDGRFPVVSLVDYSTKSILVRTSEPLLGPTNRRCIEDEAVHKAYLLNKNMGILIDTRSKNALASAKARGGGYESAFYYRSWNIIFLELPRAQDIQSSFHKVIETCNDYCNVNFHSKLNASGWLPIIATILSKAGVIAQSMHYVNPGYTHIVHGGESKDMTLMMTSLCALILDPNARTLRGFQSLIEREWILGGHPFGERCSHSAYATGGGEEAPIFICFLNCVFQMMHAYPTAFEFTDHFLINIFEHSYASEFGTFLYDSERDRHHAQLRKRTVSLWSYVNHPEILSTFMNPLYVPLGQPLWPVISGVIHVLWQRLFLRWNLTWNEADEAAAIAAAAAEKVKKLQSHFRTLLNQHSGHSIAEEGMSNLTIDG